jgi:carbon storage regulator
MLIVKRGRGDEVRIGPDVTLRVLGIGRNEVRLGIDAPKDVRIMRGELLAAGEEPHGGWHPPE